MNLNTTHSKKISNIVCHSGSWNGNFGDLIGPYLYEKITGVRPITYKLPECKDQVPEFTNYFICGSILRHANSHSHIWGVGAMCETHQIIKPQKIFAVRGPLTKNILISNDLIDNDCLSNLKSGDTGLLLPLFYRPIKKNKKYKIGLLPHASEFQELDKIIKKDNDSVVLIKNSGLNTYNEIEKIINIMCECEKILTSSLHGIVISNAYQINVAWTNFTNITKTETSGTKFFKFNDYFLSLQMNNIKPLNIISSELENINYINSKIDEFPQPDYQLVSKLQNELLQNCPL